MHTNTFLIATGALLSLACSNKDDLLAAGNPPEKTDGSTSEAPDGSPTEEPDASARCTPGMVKEDGGCVDPLRRYEPAARLDFDNVASYGAAPTMDLPDPPKSGFRLVVPPRRLAPGDEVEDCHAWAYPNITYRNVYAARVYTSGALHHGNVYGVPLADSGPSPYPACNPGQGDIFSQVGNALGGDIMDFLFANSTQIDGGEQIVFPKGMAFKIKTEGRELSLTIHWLNTSSEDFTSEVVYDFFTMPDSEMTQEIVPFVFDNQAFSIPPESQGEIDSTCNLLPRPASIVALLPHAHKRATSFDVSLVKEDGTKENILHDGAFDPGSDFHVFDQPVSVDGFTKLNYRCGVANDLNRPIVWGIGEDEMCTLSGYLYPPNAQLVGFIARGATTCLTLDIGTHRP